MDPLWVLVIPLFPRFPPEGAWPPSTPVNHCGFYSDPIVPAPQSQTHNPGRPVFSMPSHPCADQRGALSCPLTCSIGSRPLIAMNRTRPTGAERGCARWSIGRSGCTSVRKQLYVCDGAVGEIGDHGEILRRYIITIPGRGTHAITPDPASTFHFGEHGCRGIVARPAGTTATDRVKPAGTGAAAPANRCWRRGGYG